MSGAMDPEGEVDRLWLEHDLQHIGGIRHLRSVPTMPEPPDEPWRRVDFKAALSDPTTPDQKGGE